MALLTVSDKHHHHAIGNASANSLLRRTWLLGAASIRETRHIALVSATSVQGTGQVVQPSQNNLEHPVFADGSTPAFTAADEMPRDEVAARRVTRAKRRAIGENLFVAKVHQMWTQLK